MRSEGAEILSAPLAGTFDGCGSSLLKSRKGASVGDPLLCS